MAKPGDIIFDNRTNSFSIVEPDGTITNIGSTGMMGPIGHVGIQGVAGPTYTGRAFAVEVNGAHRSITERDIIKYVTAAEELEKLAEEQPAVKEAYEQLQMLIKLYRVDDGT